MTAYTLQQEFVTMRSRFHRTLTFSLVAHAALVLWLILAPAATRAPDEYVTIEWLEPLPVPVAAVVEAVPEPVAREEEPPPVEPERIDRAERLASLPALDVELTRPVPESRFEASLAGAPVSDALARSSAPAAPVAAQGRMVDLKRGPARRTEPLALTRGPAVSAGTPLAADVPTTATATAAAAAEDDGATRILDGALLAGPVAHRPVEHNPLPDYPPWAAEQAVEADVTLRFIVLPDGRVKENVQVESAAAFRDFEERAAAALRRWRFAALEPGDLREQWGTITFNFRLRD